MSVELNGSVKSSYLALHQLLHLVHVPILHCPSQVTHIYSGKKTFQELSAHYTPHSVFCIRTFFFAPLLLCQIDLDIIDNT